MFKSLINICITASILILLTACGQTDRNEDVKTQIGPGEVVNNTYKNAFFGMNMPIPETWVVNGEAMIKEVESEGEAALGDENSRVRRAIEYSKKNSYNFLYFSKHEQGSPVTSNPSVFVGAERITMAPGVKRGSDYLFHVRKLLEASGTEFTVIGDIQSETISERVFDIMTIEIEYGPTTVEQKFYASKMGEYVLYFALTAVTEDEKDELLRIVHQTNFDSDKS